MPTITKSALSGAKKLWTAITGGSGKKGGDIQGTAGAGSGYAQEIYRNYRYDIPDQPKRAIMGSTKYSRDLLEIMEWSPEARTALSFLSRDPFMEREGRIGSWRVAETINGETKVDERIIKVAEDLQNRRSGKQLVLGGLRLQEAARQALGLGDSFLQLAIEKEGITRGKYCISRTMYMPPLSMFVKEDNVGEPDGYLQELEGQDEVHFNPLKILHFSYEQRRLYGNSVLFPSIPAWTKLKRIAPATEKAVMQAGVAPWIHTMGATATEVDREIYERKHQAERSQGFLSDLYISHGAKVAKAEGNVAGLSETLTYEQNLLRRMIPLGLPPYFFSTLASAPAGAREISGQPAMLYARTIASIRSLLGEQIKWALNIELALTYGIDFVLENHYEIAWPSWEVLPPAQMSKDYYDQKTPQTKGNQDPKEKKDPKEKTALRAV